MTELNRSLDTAIRPSWSDDAADKISYLVEKFEKLTDAQLTMLAQSFNLELWDRNHSNTRLGPKHEALRIVINRRILEKLS